MKTVVGIEAHVGLATVRDDDTLEVTNPISIFNIKYLLATLVMIYVWMNVCKVCMSYVFRYRLSRLKGTNKTQDPIGICCIKN